MNVKYFEYEDIDGDDIKVEVDLNLLRIRVFVTIYNFKNEIVSKNKIVGWYVAKNKKKLINILKNNIGNMSNKTTEKYYSFIEEISK